MRSRCGSTVPGLFLFVAASLSPALAQQAAPASPQNQTSGQSQQGTPARPTYTFHAESRVVLTDVTVTDDKGNPVRGLPQGAFHIFDNKQPQTITSFQEHAGVPAAAEMPTAAHGIYSNDYLLHLPPVLNVIVIDIANLGMEEQMYLNYELTRFLTSLPAGQPLAIYLRSGSGCFLVQNFTTDRSLLLAALHKAIPRFPPLGREYLSDQETLHQIAAYLSPLEGRKNVLWFSGGSTAYLSPDGAFGGYAFVDPAAVRAIYDELETERIAVYPIDARGLTMHSGPAMWAQHGDMMDVAQATGGKAFFNNNGLQQIATQLMNTDSSFYTLTYSPHDFHFDNKWHKVNIKVDGGYDHVSYRSGYFADGSVANTGQPERASRTHLMAGGQKVEEPWHTAPIIFQAVVLPSSDPSIATLPKASAVVPTEAAKKGTVPYSVRYTLPIGALMGQVVDGKQKLEFGLAAITIGRDGDAIQRKMERVSMTLNADVSSVSPDAPIAVDQTLNLKKDDNYLYLAVWNPANGRVGTLQVPLTVRKPH